MSSLSRLSPSTLRPQVASYFDRKIRVSKGFTNGIRAQMKLPQNHLAALPGVRRELLAACDRFDAGQASAAELMTVTGRALNTSYFQSLHTKITDYALRVKASHARIGSLLERPVLQRPLVFVDGITAGDPKMTSEMAVVQGVHPLIDRVGYRLTVANDLFKKMEEDDIEEHTLFERALDGRLGNLPAEGNAVRFRDFRTHGGVRRLESTPDLVLSPEDQSWSGRSFMAWFRDLHARGAHDATAKKEYARFSPELFLAYHYDFAWLAGAYAMLQGNDAMGVVLTTLNPENAEEGSTMTELLPLDTMERFIDSNERPLEMSFLRRDLFFHGRNFLHGDTVAFHDFFHLLTRVPATPRVAAWLGHLTRHLKDWSARDPQNPYFSYARGTLYDLPRFNPAMASEGDMVAQTIGEFRFLMNQDAYRLDRKLFPDRAAAPRHAQAYHQSMPGLLERSIQEFFDFDTDTSEMIRRARVMDPD